MTGNNNLSNYLTQSITAHSRSNPGKTAITYDGKSVSYLELERKSNGIADFLHKNREQSQNVAIILDRSPELVQSIIGVLKAGLVFVPIDPAFPADRIKKLLAETRPDWVITSKEYREKFGDAICERNRNLLLTGDIDAGMECPQFETVYNKYSYIYFTSGSTGAPKGVLGRLKSLVHYIKWETQEFGVDESFNVSQLAPPSFDAYLKDIFVPLTVGGTSCIPPRNRLVDMPELIRWIDETRITLLHTVPSLFKSLVPEINDHDCFSHLKYILLAGELLRGNDVRDFVQLFKDKIQLVNLYGTTETTVLKLFHRIEQDDVNRKYIPVGKPINGAQAMILGSDMKKTVSGNTGEVYIRTPFITSGYFNDKELTKRLFMKNPFSTNPHDIIYKTGDLGRMLPDGKLEISGRVDSQVKIRGIRIELGEIENQLLDHADITDAVVTAKENGSGEKYLCAYIVSNNGGPASGFRKHLTKKLPNYMTPAYFVNMEKFPLTANGKVDKNALPEPEFEQENDYEAPTTGTEKKLVDIWAEVLGRDAKHKSQLRQSIGIRDNFFELGGHSLKATAIASAVHKAFDVRISLAELFKHPTIKGVSHCIKNARHNRFFSIEPAEVKEYYPLSSAQKRLYLLQQFDVQSTAYNMPNALYLNEDIDETAIEETFRKLIHRHESLRTSFDMIAETPVQRIHDHVEFRLDHYEGELEQCIPGFVQPFNLSRVPLLRAALLKAARTGDRLLLIDMHHIITDGSSMDILVKEFSSLYSREELPPLKLQYKDYSQWHRQFMQTAAIESQKAFWLKQFAQDIPVLNLPWDFPRPAVQAFDGDETAFKLSAGETQALNELARKEEATLFIVLLAVYNIFLSKLSGQEDIVVGTAVAGRNHIDLEPVIGMFVNTVPLRNRPQGNKTFAAFLSQLKANTLDAFRNQDYQFQNIVEDVAVERDMSRNPLFDVMFTLQNMIDAPGAAETPGDQTEDLELKPYKYKRGTSKVDLGLTAFEREGELRFTVEYCTKLFKQETIRRFFNYFLQIIPQVIENPRQTLAQLDIIPREEKQRLLFDFNRTTAVYPEDKTVHQLFEEQAGRFPDRCSVVIGQLQVTYRELNQGADRLAHTLREQGVGPDKIAAIMVERSVEMAVGILGILKAGGAYLPIDPDYPQDRIDYMLNDSSAALLLTPDEISPALTGSAPPISQPAVSQAGPANLAYIIYTSGTTGRAKGAAAVHKGVVNFISWRLKTYDFCPTDVTLQPLSYTFDGFGVNFYSSLCSGGKLVIVPGSDYMDFDYIKDLVYRCRVTNTSLVPGMFEALLDSSRNQHLESLRFVVLAGEKSSANLIGKTRKKAPHVKLYNEYGPTETTIAATFNPHLDEFTTPVIGKPIANTRIYILNQWRKLQVIGAAGELYIAGDGVTRGYLNRPQLTHDKFIRLTLDSQHLDLYKTGDLARWLPGGSIEFMGRIDHQVKIRGFRIEVGEIESQLLKHPSIHEAVVIDRADENNDRYLIAYIVSNETPDTTQLRNSLSNSLPDYMIPAHFVPLEALPLTPNGKLDRKALPDIQLAAEKNYIAPTDEIEKELVDIWSSVLGTNPSHVSQLRESIGINGNFFQLGGHSLKATVLITRIRKKFDVKISLVELFKTPTIKGLAQYIRRTGPDKFVSVEPVEKKEYYPLSSPQGRLFILQRFEPQSTAYNMPLALYLSPGVDRDALEATFRKLIARHESLRTSFEMIAGAPVQKVRDNIEFNIEYIDLPSEGTGDAGLRKIIQHSFIRPFDLSQAPLLRAAFLKAGNAGESLLLFDMHHIITDGVSQDILTKEFHSLYSGETLPPLRLQYKDYSQWQRQMETGAFGEQKEYWLNQFAGEIPVLNLPYDYPRPAVQRFEGNQIAFQLSPGQTLALNEIAQTRGATLFMVLLAVYNTLLSKLSGQEDIVVGTPIAGRNHTDLEKIIGMFINMLPLRNRPRGENTFEFFLNQLKENTLDAFDNQDYQFENTIENVSVERDMSRNPLFDVMFTLQNMIDADGPQEEPGNEGEIKPYTFEHQTSKFDLSLTAFERESKLHCSFEYCTKLFKEETVRRFINYFREIVSAVIKNPGKTLSEIEMMSEEEKKKILFDFNETRTQYPKDKTFHQLFQEQAEKSNDRCSVIFGHSQITYRELNHRANRLAYALRGKGVGPGTIAAIKVERSIRLIVGILGILKSGAAYLPLDPIYPPDRIEYILRDSSAALILTGEEITGAIHAPPAARAPTPGAHKALPRPPASGLAYTIYTSGSTGRPKGVMIPHRALNNFIKGITQIIPFSAGDTVLSLTTVSFDIFGLEVLLPLTRGSKVIVGSPDEQMNPEAAARAISDKHVSILQVTPSRLTMLVEHDASAPCLKKLRYLLVGGEAFPGQLLEKTRQLGVNKIYNMYGPTETTIWSTVKDVSPGKDLNIGKPIANTGIYILGKGNALQPVGIAGELCISGDGLARGYINRPELTAEKFVQLTLNTRDITMYKTGDLARWLPNGNIQCLGRTDHQVKIRGFRIELGEIEKQLLKCPGIGEAVVIDRNNSQGKKFLCAYVVTQKEPDTTGIRNFLSTYLPDYMIPSYVIRIEKIPLTDNGKISRKKLEAVSVDMRIGAEYAEPQNEIEQKISDAWKKVLQLDKVGIHENFFDAGGTSLDVIKLNTLFKEAFGETDTMVQMFRYPTIHSFAAYLIQKDQEPSRSRQNANRSIPVDRVKKEREKQRQKRKRR